MANKIYQVELTLDNLSKLINKYNNVSKSLGTMEFKEFLLDKCIKARNQIMLDRDIAHIENANDSANQEKVDKYIAGNHEEINGDTISLYNDAHLSVGELTHFFNETYRDTQYSDGFSLSELVEYGAGLVGASSSLGTGDEWEYESNSKRDYNEGWSYKGDNGSPEHTNGSEGKYIYYYLAETIENNIDDWVEEFLDKKMGSVL